MQRVFCIIGLPKRDFSMLHVSSSRFMPFVNKGIKIPGPGESELYAGPLHHHYNADTSFSHRWPFWGRYQLVVFAGIEIMYANRSVWQPRVFFALCFIKNTLFSESLMHDSMIIFWKKKKNNLNITHTSLTSFSHTLGLVCSHNQYRLSCSLFLSCLFSGLYCAKQWCGIFLSWWL